MDILITGGAGFIGSNLVDKLLLSRTFNKIYILDNLVRTNGFRNIQHVLGVDKVVFLYGDVSTFDFFSIPNVNNIKFVFHLAATRINRCSQFNKEGHQYIADGGFNVVDFCHRNKSKLFFASTASVYQNPKRFPIEEDDACCPHTIYGSAKYYTEGLIRSYNKMHGLDYTINRFFSVYGERMDNNGVYTEVIFNWLNSIKNGNNKITVFGDPEKKIIDLVHVEDVIKIIIGTTFGSTKEVFNVSTETGITLMELIKTIEKVTNVKLEIQTLEESRNDIESKRIGSIDKIRKLDPNLLPSISLEQGIKRTYDWINKS